MIINKDQKIEITIPPHQESETIELQENSEAHVIIDGTRKLRLDAVLCGNNARLAITGIFSGIKEEEQNITLAVIQDARHTRCDIRFRSVLDHSSISRFDGLIRMTENAIDAHARLSYRGMLVSKHARAMPIPRLEVLTKQVASATHEAAVGTIDPQQLFYLQSRGLSEAMAKQLLIDGFFVCL